MSNFTFLSEEQIFERDKLSVIEKRGTKAAITDFAIMLGGYVDDDYHVDGKSGLEDRTGWYWTRSDNGTGAARAMVIGTTTTLMDVMLVVGQLHRSQKSAKSPRTERVGKEREMVS